MKIRKQVDKLENQANELGNEINKQSKIFDSN
jgi:hypothetical protein